MPKFIKYFSLVATFIIGASVGTYLGIVKELEDKKERSNNIIPVQDVVIRNVQEEKNKETSDEAVETVVEETKLSPYAKMIIEKKFNKCGHTTVDIVDLPLELVNMTEIDIMKKYPDWTIRNFNSSELSLFREINANCNDHFVLKERDGYLAVFNEVTDDTMNLKEVTDIDVNQLPSGDAEALKDGISVYGKEALASLMENFNS